MWVGMCANRHTVEWHNVLNPLAGGTPCRTIRVSAAIAYYLSGTREGVINCKVSPGGPRPGMCLAPLVLRILMVISGRESGAQRDWTSGSQEQWERGEHGGLIVLFLRQHTRAAASGPTVGYLHAAPHRRLCSLPRATNYAPHVAAPHSWAPESRRIGAARQSTGEAVPGESGTRQRLFDLDEDDGCDWTTEMPRFFFFLLTAGPLLLGVYNPAPWRWMESHPLRGPTVLSSFDN